jgi:MoaA/NifB/PqqE/SkfB family radical SAM enzyme
VVRKRFWIDRDRLGQALPILYRRGIRYVTFQGGEPLMHRGIDQLVRDAKTAGLRPALITNGWRLPEMIGPLIDMGLATLKVSIDSHSLTEHERNRGLPGVGERIRQGLAIARKRGLPTFASVTVNRLVQYDALPKVLGDLGFDCIVFSYPRRKPLGSSSLAYSKHSRLIDYDFAELVHIFEAIKSLKKIVSGLECDGFY